MSSIEDQNFVSNINSIITYLIYYFSVYIVNFGIIVNILNIMVFSNPRVRKGQTGTYNILISFFNILSLVFFQLNVLAPAIGMQDLKLQSNFACFSISYFTRVFSQMSTWITILATLDRVIMISKENRFKFFNDKKFLIWIILALFFFLSAVNVPNLFVELSTYSVEKLKTNQTITYTVCKSNNLVSSLRSFAQAIFRSLLPVILAIFFNIVLLKKLARNRDLLNENLKFRREFRFSYIIVFLNFFSIAALLPLLFIAIYFGIQGLAVTTNVSLNASKTEAIAQLIYFCIISFQSYMFCSLFFINLFIDKQFKREIRMIFCGPILTQYAF